MSEVYSKKSKPTTVSYFMMRLRNSGYRVERLFNFYGPMDPRIWTVIIDPGCASILCTCYVNRNPAGDLQTTLNDSYFEFYDGGQFMPSNVKIKTQSVEVLITHLVKYGINNKDSSYPNNVLNNNDNSEPVDNPALPSNSQN